MPRRDPEAARAYQREWQRRNRIKNGDAVRAAARAKYRKNRERILQQVKEHQKRNAERIAERKRARYAALDPVARRDATLRWLYGIGHDDYLAMYEAQNGRCAICNDERPVLDVDHCHASGRVRGLLCQKCNKAIGLLKDSPSILMAAIGYLAKSAAGALEG